MPPTARMAIHHMSDTLLHPKSSSPSPRWHPYGQRSPHTSIKARVDQPLTHEASANPLTKEHLHLSNMVECGSSLYGSPEPPQDRTPPPSYSHVHSPIPTYTYPLCPATAPLQPTASSFPSSFTFASHRVQSDPPPRFPSPSHYSGRPLRPSGARILSHWSPEDGSKHRHAKGLIDQALQLVATLWDAPHEPSQAQSQRSASAPNSPPSTSTTPELVYSPHEITDPEQRHSSSTHGTQGKENIPIHLFVHELLRRSRTSQAVLDTAVAYIKAAEPAVKLARSEGGKSLNRKQSHSDLGAQMGDSQGDPPASHGSTRDLLSSSLVAGWDSGAPTSSSGSAGPKHPSLSISNTHTDSPLADPRRTFLAALILASKFLHDKPYSNKAWARLSGLEPREVSRCERALGEALGWKLWLKGQEMQTGLHALRAGESLFDSPSTSAASSEYQASPAMPTDSMMTPPPSKSGYRRPSTVPSTPTKGHLDMMKRTQSMPNSGTRGGLPALYPFALLPMLQSALQLQPGLIGQSQPSSMEWSGMAVNTH